MPYLNLLRKLIIEVMYIVVLYVIQFIPRICIHLLILGNNYRLNDVNYKPLGRKNAYHGRLE